VSPPDLDGDYSYRPTRRPHVIEPVDDVDISALAPAATLSANTPAPTENQEFCAAVHL
jgi:hypothetical protein